MLSLCFPKEIADDGVVIDPVEMIDGVIPYDEYQDEMDELCMSQITSIVQPKLALPFDLFRVSIMLAP